jgi:hypothetical protein
MLLARVQPTFYSLRHIRFSVLPVANSIHVLMQEAPSGPMPPSASDSACSAVLQL